MKKVFKIILQYYLKSATKIVLWVHRPIVIAVAGSVNKSFMRDEIKKVLLAKNKTVRVNPKNFNTEIGLPLAILDIESGYNSYRRWLPVIGNAFKAIFQKNFPEYLVLELGVSQAGDMRYLLSIVRPEIVIITDITQRYIESFSGMEQLADEYSYLMKNMKKDGMAILNWDNDMVRTLKDASKVPVLYFSRKNPLCDGNIIRITKVLDGISVKMRYMDEEKEMHVKRFGNHHAACAMVGWMLEKETD